MRRAWARLLLAVTLSGGNAAMHAQDVRPAFDVASIRQLERPAFRAPVIGTMPGGRFVASNATVYSLIEHAYGIVSPETIEGGPAWVQSDRFDLDARSAMESQSSRRGVVGPFQLMLQRLLAERFNLQLHVARRPKAVLALVLGRSDGKLGPQIRTSSRNCEADAAVAKAKALEPGAGAAAGDIRAACSVTTTNGTTDAAGVPMATVASALGLLMRGVVVDRTGLTGTFDFTLSTAPVLRAELVAQMEADGVQLNLPRLDDAVREQLGLRLQPATVDVNVYIIDRLERPTAN